MPHICAMTTGEKKHIVITVGTNCCLKMLTPALKLMLPYRVGFIVTFKAVVTDGLNLDRTSAEGVDFPDPKDIVFYEVALSKEDSFLVTGNVKHFPVKPFVVTPAEIVKIIG